MKKENNEMVAPKKRELTGEEMQAIFQILLFERPNSYIALKEETINTFPKKILFTYEFDEANQVWHLKMPKAPRKRKKIITRKKPKI